MPQTFCCVFSPDSLLQTVVSSLWHDECFFSSNHKASFPPAALVLLLQLVFSASLLFTLLENVLNSFPSHVGAGWEKKLRGLLLL